MGLRPRSRKAGTGAVVGLLAAAATMTMAVATPANASSATRLAAPPPSTSPAPERVVFTPGGTVDCPSGRACAGVPVASGGGYVFQFYKYGRYRLNYFLGTGPVYNNQTDRAAMRFYDRNGVQVKNGCLPPKVHRQINWDPIWYIGLTQTPC
ncbi:hypothetical protein [Spirillospora sp. NPDC047279]|uniref:hypothetical protein n=1 Tax=Spirillospora sp. NPDC047279 TaxID=3155478 RepID=UPI003402252F